MITGGFKNMDADQIIKCILAVMLKLEKSIDGVVEDRIVDGVVDKAPSQNAVYDADKNLSDRISTLENPDTVLKYSDEATETLIGLDLSLLGDAYEWRVNGVVTDNAPAYSTTLTEASDGFYKFALLQGSTEGTYSIKYSVETSDIGSIPQADANNIGLRAYLIFGDVVNKSVIVDTTEIYISTPGDIDFLPLNTTASTLNIGAADSLTGFNIPADKIYSGKDYYIRGDNTILKNNTGTNNVRFYSPQGDMFVPDNINVHYKFFANNIFGGLGYLTLIGIDWNKKENSVNKQNSFIVDGTGVKYYSADYINSLVILSSLPEQLDFRANGIDNFIDIGTTKKVKSFFYETVLQEKVWWSQEGTIVTFTFSSPPPLNALIQFT